MASDRTDYPKCGLTNNIQVKVEPGTSELLGSRSIKMEPGVTSTTTRLTSFRVPRDLTLGGNIKTEKVKKIYTPNLNAQRNKKKDNAAQIKSESARSSRDKDHGRGRGRGDRGRNKASNNLIQSTGVFSEGITDLPNKRYGRSRANSDSKDTQRRPPLEKPKLNLNLTVDKAEEEEKLKLLLRDDFIDDGFDPNLDNAPVMLPMVEDVKLYTEMADIGTSIDKEEQEDKKPILLENGEVMEAKEAKPKIPISDVCKKKKLPITLSEIIENKTNSYVLMQFPDCLPGLESSSDAHEPRSKRSTDSHVERESNTSKPEYCTLNNLKGGLLGKLQIFKSGKAQLCLGENNLIVDVGSTVSFRQDLIAAKVDTITLNGELINLGSVNSTLICSPDWESMLAKL